MPLLCIDIGGTDIKHGLVDAEGHVLQPDLMPTNAPAGGEAMFARLAALALGYQGRVSGIAVSTFGSIEPATGRVTALADAVPGYAGMALGERLAAQTGLPVTVENDVNCVALAEQWQGAARDVDHFIALTIGTGIGGAVVINRALYRGFRYAAGEWGYMQIDGQVWEDVASTRGLVARVAAQTAHGVLDGRRIFALADEGDVPVQSAVAAWMRLLATGIANLIFALNPERVVIGGGVAGRGEAFLQPLQAAVRAQLHPDIRDEAQLVLAAAGNHAGLIGAAYNWHTRYGRPGPQVA
ncbi:MAG: ROK family protein [Burkholderiales bacterium]|nr:ROK family protein [Burkholderiales bacterium]